MIILWEFYGNFVMQKACVCLGFAHRGGSGRGGFPSRMLQTKIICSNIRATGRLFSRCLNGTDSSSTVLVVFRECVGLTFGRVLASP